MVRSIIPNEPTRISDLTSSPHFKRSIMFCVSESEKAVVMVALAEYQALTFKKNIMTTPYQNAAI